jgi:AraC-like DNA-binding protein/quercetin dioxygenase-like cupin family protein
MKPSSQTPISFRIVKSPDHALLVQVDEGTGFYGRLHYHPEYQITAIERGEGLLYAGTSVSSFEPGDVFILGSEMPHLFKETAQHNSIGVRAVSLFFDEASLGQQFFETKELQVLIRTLHDSNRGMKAGALNTASLHHEILETVNLKEEYLYIRFLEILSRIARSSPSYLNDDVVAKADTTQNQDRLNEVINFALKTFDQEIKIEHVAEMSFLSRSHFSAAFKLKTGKTFIDFLNTIRIENACIQLKNQNTTIEQACYASGFRNASNFVRQFKRIKKMTPSQYRKTWQLNRTT